MGRARERQPNQRGMVRRECPGCWRIVVIGPPSPFLRAPGAGFCPRRAASFFPASFIILVCFSIRKRCCTNRSQTNRRLTCVAHVLRVSSVQTSRPFAVAARNPPSLTRCSFPTCPTVCTCHLPLHARGPFRQELTPHTEHFRLQPSATNRRLCTSSNRTRRAGQRSVYNFDEPVSTVLPANHNDA